MIKKIEKIKSWQIFAFSASILICRFLAVSFFNFFTENSARKDGSLHSFTLTAEDFELRGIEKTKDGYKTTDHDSQLVRKESFKFSTLRFTMTYTVEPGEIVFYYRTGDDEHFSEQKRRWAIADDTTENGYIVTLPMKEVTAIRLDPSMFAGNDLTFGDFVFNREKSFSDYFDITYSTFFDLILYTALFSACFKYRQDAVCSELWSAFRERKRK